MKMRLLSDKMYVRINCYLVVMWIAVILTRMLRLTSTFFWIVNMIGFIILFLRYTRYPDKPTLTVCLGAVSTGIISFILNVDYLSGSLKSIGMNVGILTLPMFLCLFTSLKQYALDEKEVVKILRCFSILGSITIFSAFMLDFKNIVSVALGRHSSYGLSLSGLFYGKNIYGAFLSLAMCADLYLYKSGTRKHGESILPCIIKLIGVILSFSRAALLQAVIALVLFFWFSRKRAFKEWAAAIVIAVSVSIFILGHPEIIQIVERQVLRIDVGDAGRAAARYQSLSVIPQGAITKLWGVGYAGVDTLSLDIDNSYYYTYFTGGAIKVVMYIALMIKGIVNALRLKKTNLYLGNICLAVGISYIIYSYFESVPLFEMGLINFCFMIFMYFFPMGYLEPKVCEE